MQHVDCLIIGGGLAGTTLAWSLRWHGLSVMLVDRGEPSTASRIAAGLVTPLTGKRLAVSERFAEFWPVAKRFYERVQGETEASFLRSKPALRLLCGEEERAVWHQRREEPDVAEFAREATPHELGPWRGNYRGVSLSSARLDVAKYLSVSQQVFAAEDSFQQGELTLENLSPANGGYHWQAGEVTASTVALCRGPAESERGAIALEPAKGEILTIRCDDDLPHCVIHAAGIWVAPCGEKLYRIGATFDRDRIDNRPTLAGRDWLLDRLGQFLPGPVEVINHQAAVRPIAAGRRPVARRLADQPKVAVLNGLGAKGVLWAPSLAENLAQELVSMTR